MQQTNKRRPKKKLSQMHGEHVQSLFTLASKSVYMDVNDKAFDCMYERRINLKDLQIWLKRNKNMPTQKLNQKL
jgi:hypothetical protein